jgi:hypothetical protein
MSWDQIAENWNGQVGRLYNWTINRLASAAEKGDVKAMQTDCHLPSVKARKHAGQEEYHEIQHEEPGGRQVSQSEG